MHRHALPSEPQQAQSATVNSSDTHTGAGHLPNPVLSGGVRVCNDTQMKRIQKLLNFAARVLTGRRKFDHISDVLHRLNWFTAEHMHLYHGLIC